MEGIQAVNCQLFILGPHYWAYAGVQGEEFVCRVAGDWFFPRRRVYDCVSGAALIPHMQHKES